MKVEIEKKSCLNPKPKAIVTVRDKNGRDNALVVAYCCNCSYDPPMVMVGIVPSRFSHHMVKENGSFVVHLVEKSQTKLYEVCGSESGREYDKLKKCGTKMVDADVVNACILDECPVAIECTVVDSILTGSHEMFVGKVEKVHAEEKYLIDGKVDFTKLELI